MLSIKFHIIQKVEKLYVNTNYSILLNNTRKEKENDKKIFTKIFKFYNSRPMTLNFSNEINNFNSYKMLLNNNKSMKYWPAANMKYLS